MCVLSASPNPCFHPLSVQHLPVWPSKEKIKEHLPDSFKGKYENVRGILDCTELKCELPKEYKGLSEAFRNVFRL